MYYLGDKMSIKSFFLHFHQISIYVRMIMVMIMLNETVAQKLIKIVAQNGVGDVQLVQISLMDFYPGVYS